MSVSSEVGRTLVKSPPELWTELSDPTTLARHLGELGEIRIIGTEPERIVVWEAATGDGAEVSGRVELQPSGWGTRVTLSASRSVVAPEPAAREHEPEMVDVIPETPTEVELAEESVAGTSAEPTADPQPVTAIEPEPEPALAGEPGPRQGFFARLFRRRRNKQAQIESAPNVLADPAPEPVAESEPVAEPEPSAAVEIEEPALAQATPEEPAQAEESTPETEESTPEMDIAAELAELEEQTTAVLTGVLDRLGAAHHRPFSRA